MKKENKKISTKAGINLTSHISHLTSNSRGITLVALIITIIIMLILAGVSISIAVNGGLFDITKKAAKETENAKNLEQALVNGRIKIGDTWYDSIEDYVNDKPSSNQGESGGETPVTPPEEPDTSIYENVPKDANGLLTANAKYTSDGKTAVVPKGFKIVDGTEGTKSIADGLVIQDKDGNEFVWIPVEVMSSDTETSITSFYRSEWENNERGASLMDNTQLTEPYANGYTGEDTEYATMVKSVYKNKGFYIGRYETGSVDEEGQPKERTNTENGTTEMVVKKNQIPYNYVGWGLTMSDWESDVIDSSNRNQGKGAVRLSKEMYQNKDVGVTSTLCYGVQWDAMLDFIKDKKNVTSSLDWGNYTEKETGLVNTGSSDSYSAKNIYDIAGNVQERTMEANSSNLRVFRGGGFANSGLSCSACYRGSNTINFCNGNVGFRVALFVK